MALELNSILNLGKMVQQIIGFGGEIITDKTKPDGTPRKLMDVSKLTSLGWRVIITLEEGVKRVFEEIKDLNWSDR